MIRLTNRLNNVDEVSTLSQLQDVNTDLILTLCGEKLGSGSYRSVYEFNMNPNKMVVKVEPKSTDCNIAGLGINLSATITDLFTSLLNMKKSIKMQCGRSIAPNALQITAVNYFKNSKNEYRNHKL